MEELKEQIYKLICDYDLNEDEIAVIDTYVNKLLENFTKIEATHQKIISDQDELRKFKELLLESLVSED